MRVTARFHPVRLAQISTAATGKRMRVRPGITALTLVAATYLAVPLLAQVTPDRLLKAAAEPQNWLTYSGGYASQRHSPLTQVTPGNVKNLELKWILPNQVFGAWQSSPIVVDGIMYVTQRPNDVLALDAKTGRVFWQYRYSVAPEARVCCGANNRGVAIHGDTLYMGTLDGHLVALDATIGRPLWNIAVGDPKLGYSITMAPLVVKDKVLVGVGGV
jgi:alcohol dehydrogenase (cytochrome c)